MLKKILILGAGIYQVPLIKKAKEMGLYTIVVSARGNYPGFEIADKVYYEDTTNVNIVLEIAQVEKIDGICTTGTDVAVKTIGKVCEELGLCGISESAAIIATDKLLMKEAFEKSNVRSGRFEKAFTIEDAIYASKQIGLPVMIKAVDSSGSRGIIKVNHMDDIFEAFNIAKSSTKKEYIVVEKFIDGYEIGIDGFVVNNKVELLLPHGKLVYDNGKTGVPLGHYFPFECSEKLIRDIEIQFENVVNGIGFNNCAVNMDVLINNDKAYIIEAGGRAGATCIPELITVHCGFNYYEKIIKCALGEEVDFNYKKNIPCAAKLIVSEKSGEISEIFLDENDEDIMELSLDYTIGERVNKFAVGPDRIGHMVIMVRTEDIKKEIDEKLSKVKLKVK